MAPRLQTILAWAAAAALYYVAAWAGSRMAVFPEGASPFWPATGVAIAALTLLGLRAWPAIAAAVFLVELPAFGVGASALLTIGNTLEAVVGAWFLRRLGGPAAFTSGMRVGGFLGAMVLASLPSAAFAAAPLMWLGGPTPLVHLVATWYLGNVTGGILFAPALILLARPVAAVRRSGREWAGFLMTGIAVAFVAFFPWRDPSWAEIRIGFLAIGPLVWAASRFGPPVTALTTLVMSLAALIGLRAGEAPSPAVQNALLLQMQTLAGALAGIGLYIAATVHQGARTIQVLEENQTRLRAADHVKAAFLNKAAHELRTPLTPLRLQVHYLRSHPDTTPGQQRSLDILGRSAQRMTRIVDRLVQAARIDESTRMVVPADAPVQEIADAAIAAATPAARARSITLEVHAHGGAARLDRVAMRRILDELLDNAVRCAPTGGHVVLEVDVSPDGSSRWTVDDDGPGVPPADRERIFDAFSQGDTSQPETGHGLGLYITRALVGGHGGRIWVEDAPAGGARFAIELPGA